MTNQPILLAIIEVGGYPDFTHLYEKSGYQVVTVRTIRKALKAIKQSQPLVVVAEFNYQSDFRDRTSSLESLMSVLERTPSIRTIVFYDHEFYSQFEHLKARYTFHRELAFPIKIEELEQAIAP